METSMTPSKAKAMLKPLSVCINIFIVFSVLGLVMKLFHIPGANPLMAMGIFYAPFSQAAILCAYTLYRKDEGYLATLCKYATHLGIGHLMLFVYFRFMGWPGYIPLGGLAIVISVIVLIYLFMKLRKTNTLKWVVLLTLFLLFSVVLFQTKGSSICKFVTLHEEMTEEEDHRVQQWYQYGSILYQEGDFDGASQAVKKALRGLDNIKGSERLESIRQILQEADSLIQIREWNRYINIPIDGYADVSAVGNSGIYNFEMLDIDGNTVKLERYKGKVLLIVNTASHCGHTPQYEGLEKMYQELNSRGFEILDFPCNQFGEQAPENDTDYKAFCQVNYHVDFPQFSKIEVNGENAHPLYVWLKNNANDKGDIGWNFTKFLIDREGKVIQRFNPDVKADSMMADVLKVIEE